MTSKVYVRVLLIGQILSDLHKTTRSNLLLLSFQTTSTTINDHAGSQNAEEYRKSREPDILTARISMNAEENI
uniref:Secreted protein n=1 Tax=Ascaris lumbricoides TaxID=6252 RepID=A0A0M3IGX0_ASCLU